jgi:hypothetical protein
MSEAIVDATVVEDAPSTALTRVRHEVLVPLDVTEQAAAMRIYQEGLKSILDENDWQNAGRGEKFVKKSGWRKIAAWYSLSIQLIQDNVDRADDGSVMRAQVWARAIAPNGRYADADGYCDVSESRFARNKAKLENDLRGTASTRAINRAISNLVGMGAVSHEEMVTVDIGPPYGPAASPEQQAQLGRALTYVFDDAAWTDDAMRSILKRCGGYLPLVVMQAIGGVAGDLKIIRQARDIEAETTAHADVPA